MRGQYGKGITHVTINGYPLWKVQINRLDKPRVQRCFKHYDSARLFAIEKFKEYGYREDQYAMLLDPDFYQKWIGK